MLIQLVAVPLGHPEDLSPRARKAIEEAEIIICEDTRKTRTLAELCHMTLSARLLPLPAAKEEAFDWNAFLDENRGKTIVSLSDAGTPVLNDPGRYLIMAAKSKGWQIKALPGPSAPMLALQWSGGFGLPLNFAGFVPKKKVKDFFVKNLNCKTLIYFETKHHFEDSFRTLIELGHGQRKIFVAREMTKTHEELLEGSVEEVFQKLKQLQKKQSGALGEMTMVLEGEPSLTLSEPLSLEDIKILRTSSVKDASKLAAKLSGLTKSEIYGEILSWKN